MIILFKYCADMKNSENFRVSVIYIYIYIYIPTFIVYVYLIALNFSNRFLLK